MTEIPLRSLRRKKGFAVPIKFTKKQLSEARIRSSLKRVKKLSQKDLGDPTGFTDYSD